MSKIKDAKRSILQIMPAEGWVAVFQDDDGTLSEDGSCSAVCLGYCPRDRQENGAYAGHWLAY
jgi:hypothetical protein